MLGKIFLWIGVISFCIVVITSFPFFLTKSKAPLEFVIPSSSWLKFSLCSTLLAIAFMVKQITEKE